MLHFTSIRTALFAGLLLSGVGYASIVSAEEEAPPPPVGTETRAWTELQASNSAASAAPRPLPGDIADRIYERYADSFSRPVPEHLGRESFVEGGSGGGGQ